MSSSDASPNKYKKSETVSSKGAGERQHPLRCRSPSCTSKFSFLHLAVSEEDRVYDSKGSEVQVRRRKQRSFDRIEQASAPAASAAPHGGVTEQADRRRAHDRLVVDSVHRTFGDGGPQPLQDSHRRCLFDRSSHGDSARRAGLRVSCHQGTRTLAKQSHLYDFSGTRGMWSCPGTPLSACRSCTAFF